MDGVVCLESLALAGREVSRLWLPLMNTLYCDTALELNLGLGHEHVYRKLKKKKKMFSLVQWTILCTVIVCVGEQLTDMLLYNIIWYFK